MDGSGIMTPQQWEDLKEALFFAIVAELGCILVCLYNYYVVYGGYFSN
jgi:hypothetical protein